MFEQQGLAGGNAFAGTNYNPTPEEQYALQRYAPINQRLGVVKIKPTVSAEMRELIKKGWRAVYSELFDTEEKPFVARLAPHHIRAIKWHWISRHRVLRGQKPKYYSYFPIFSRGHMKSTLARRIAVVDAILSLYYGQGGYCLYFSGTDKKTESHAKTIDLLLKSEPVRKHAPQLSQVRKNEEGGRSLGWKATLFYTAAGYVFHFGSLQSGLAGGNHDDIRPTMMIPDDIDDRSDSPVIAKKNFELFTTEILPMGAHGTLTFFAQNLINRYSIMYRIHSGQARVLTDRMPAVPIPAIIGLKTEIRTVNGIVRDIIIEGTPTWDYFDIEACQNEINRIGLPAFLRECQHEVEQSREGLLLKNYDDSIHVITESEFEKVFGVRGMPKYWYKDLAHDWARTKTEFHANVALFLATSPQNSPLPGFQFIFHPMSFEEDVQPETVAERILNCLSPTVEIGAQAYTWQEIIKMALTRENVGKFIGKTTEYIKATRKAIASFVPKFSKPLLESWRINRSRMSHEAAAQRIIYNDCFGFGFIGVNPGADGGIDFIDAAFKIDKTLPHPFRPDKLGYTRMFLVVPDHKLKPAAALKPDELHDHDLFRYQMKNWRTRPPKLTETGEQIDQILKANDDFGNALMMLFYDAAFENTPLTEAEEVEVYLSHEKPELSSAALEQAETDEHRAIIHKGQQREINKYLEEIEARKNKINTRASRLRRRE
jgi:hypothetical protein